MIYPQLGTIWTGKDGIKEKNFRNIHLESNRDSAVAGKPSPDFGNAGRAQAVVETVASYLGEERADIWNPPEVSVQGHPSVPEQYSFLL